MRLALIALIALLACGKPSEPAGSGAGSEAPRLHIVSRLPATSALVDSSRRIAIDADGRWLETTADSLQPVAETATALTRLRGALGELSLHLGRTVIAIGGEEHHEQIVRIGGAPVTLEGHVVRVVATDTHEVWSYDERLRARLAVVDAQVTPLPALALIGKPIVGASLVSTKLCATPAIKDLVASRDSVVALVVECDPDAAVRLVTYRWPGPTETTERLASTHALGFVPARLAIASDVRAVAGAAPDRGLRVLAVGKPVRTVAGNTLGHLAVSDAGAVWVLADGALDRDGEPVTVSDPAGTRLVPRALARDHRLGIVVLATAPGAAWLLAERR
ncbi:MAG: hypothetical protein WKG01_35695 [Kofleriaceae bacterium]